MIHKFLRAVGFSAITDRSQVDQLIRDTVHHADRRHYSNRENGVLVGEFSRDYANRVGIAVCGEFNREDVFLYDYYYPYLKGGGISTSEEISVERHAAMDSYAGVCDEARVGVSLIFYLQERMAYMRAASKQEHPLRGATLTLSALADEGSILFPIQKTEQEKEIIKKKSFNRYRMITAAKKGNESAIESLTLQDMDMYTVISKRIRDSDVFSLVDSYFMPFGVECDHYSVLGEILKAETFQNSVTNETVHVMRLNCNDLLFDVAINDADLTGEPMPGRRFKGNIWMQGRINYAHEA